MLAGIFAQFLLASGLLLSVATVGDCSLVETTVHLELPSDEFFELQEGFNFTTNLGLIFFAKPNGDCYWYDFGNFPENQLEWYINDATPEWNVARGFAALGVLIGLIVFLYSLSVTCSAQKRGMRRFVAFISSVALACFQCLTFMVFPTAFCDDAGCRASRASIFCAVSAFLYFGGGICFLFMSDYPGATLLAEEKMRVAIHEKPTEPMEDKEQIVNAYPAQTEEDDQLLHITPESSVDMETYSLDPENPNNEPIDDSSSNAANSTGDDTESPYVESDSEQALGANEANEILEADKNIDEVKDRKEDEENDVEIVQPSTTQAESDKTSDVVKDDIERQEKVEMSPPSTTPTDENQAHEAKETLATN